jgi:hypothetical protein
MPDYHWTARAARGRDITTHASVCQSTTQLPLSSQPCPPRLWHPSFLMPSPLTRPQSPLAWARLHSYSGAMLRLPRWGSCTWSSSSVVFATAVVPCKRCNCGRRSTIADCAFDRFIVRPTDNVDRAELVSCHLPSQHLLHFTWSPAVWTAALRPVLCSTWLPDSTCPSRPSRSCLVRGAFRI